MTYRSTSKYLNSARSASPAPLCHLLDQVRADLLVIVDETGSIRYASPSARRLLGHAYAPGGERRAYDTHVHPEDLPALRRVLSDLPSTERLTLLPLRVRHQNGEWLHFEAAGIDLRDDREVQGFAIAARDVTAQRQAEQRTRSLQRVTAALVSSATLEEVVDVIVVEALEATGAFGGTVTVLDGSGERLRVVGTGAQQEDMRRTWTEVPLDVPVPLTRAVRERAVICVNADEIERDHPVLWAVRPPGLQSVMALPLIVDDRVVGALGLHFKHRWNAGEAELEFVQALAGLCAQAVHRALMHDQLRAREERYEKLTRLSRDMITVIAPDGTLLYDTNVMKNVIGYDPDELLGRNMLEYVHPDDLNDALAAIARAQANPEPVTVTYRFRHSRGHWVWLESIAANHAGDPEIGGILVNSRDVTRRIASDEALREVHGAFEQLFAANPQPMWVFDTETLKFLEVNHAAVTKYGYTRDEFLRMTVADIRPPEDMRALLPHMTARTSHLGEDLGTGRHLLKGGREIHVEVRTHVTHVRGRPGKLVVVDDVTEHRATRRALEESERQFRALAENSSNVICTYQLDGTNVYVSPAARSVLGYEPAEFLQRSWQDILHPEDYPELRRSFDDIIAQRTDSARFEMRARHKGGHWVWTDTTFRLVRDPVSGDATEIHSSSRDITKRKLTELQLHEQLLRSQQLIDLTYALETQHEPSEVAREALERCVNLTEFTAGFYSRIDGHSTTIMHIRGEPPAQLEALARRFPTLESLGAAGPVLLAGQAIFTRLRFDQLDATTVAALAGFESLCALPVFASGQLRGLFVLLSPAGEISAASERLLRAIAERVSSALERSLHVSQLSVSREETLRSIGLVLEHRDYETAGHTDRVARLTEQLGHALGLRGTDLDVLRWGAYLHDTGKVAIPDSILLKPGKLTPEEFEAVKLHTTIGYELLCKIPSLPPESLAVVLHHHEKWDGSGYPSRLSGTDIPLPARIFAVIDVYDALTSERPYKRAWSPQEALAEIERTAGSHFDPTVAAVFARLQRGQLEGVEEKP